jgi:hypothetical protein
MARDLMIEFVGGEPAEQLRHQFSVARHSKPACVQSVRRRVFATKFRLSTIRPCQKARVIWLGRGPDAWHRDDSASW